jgi:hypothetical protein
MCRLSIEVGGPSSLDNWLLLHTKTKKSSTHCFNDDYLFMQFGAFEPTKCGAAMDNQWRMIIAYLVAIRNLLAVPARIASLVFQIFWSISDRHLLYMLGGLSTNDV